VVTCAPTHQLRAGFPRSVAAQQSCLNEGRYCVDALIKAVRKLPTTLRKSLTWDRGSELTDHAKFTVATDVKVYFCDPYSPWQRGSDENTNGLLRQTTRREWISQLLAKFNWMLWPGN
jgi:IS30 family transposase